MKKTLIIFVVAILLVGGGAFYGGMKYQQSKSSSGNLTRQNFQNLSQGQRQQLSGGRGGGSGFLGGEVLNKDAQSLTIKMTDGSSKIVFFSASTTISRMAEGSVNDIETGKQIIVTGSQNSDGSYTATTIQIR